MISSKAENKIVGNKGVESGKETKYKGKER